MKKNQFTQFYPQALWYSPIGIRWRPHFKSGLTIVDLDANQNRLPEHIAESIYYRSLYRENWGV